MTLSPEDKAALAAIPSEEKLAIVRAVKALQREVLAAHIAALRSSGALRR